MTAADPGRFLVRARKRREVMMRSTCRVLRPAGQPVFNPADGTYSDPGTTTVFEGKCHIKPTFSPAEQSGDTAEDEQVVQAYEVIIPWDAPRVDVGDSVDVTASDDAWAISYGPMPVAWIELADSRTARHLTVFTQDRPGVS